MIRLMRNVFRHHDSWRRCSWATLDLIFELRTNVETLNWSQKLIPILGLVRIPPNFAT